MILEPKTDHMPSVREYPGWVGPRNGFMSVRERRRFRIVYFETGDVFNNWG